MLQKTIYLSRPILAFSLYLSLSLSVVLCLDDNLVSFVAQFFPPMEFNYAYAESPALKIYALNANRLMSEVTV